MKKQAVIDYYGGVAAAAKALKISDVAIYKWHDPIPKVRAYELERLTKGKLKFDPALYQKAGGCMTNLIQFSKANLRNPVGVLTCPVAAAATFTNDYNITQLTEQIGCRSNKTLLAKLNNDSDFHHLTLEEARRITAVTGDLRILKAWACGLDHQLIPAVPVAPSDEEFSDQLLLMAQRIGTFSASMLEARADGVITKADLAEIKRHAAKAIESIMQLELECEAQVRDWGTDTDV